MAPTATATRRRSPRGGRLPRGAEACPTAARAAAPRRPRSALMKLGSPATLKCPCRTPGAARACALHEWLPRRRSLARKEFGSAWAVLSSRKGHFAKSGLGARARLTIYLCKVGKRWGRSAGMNSVRGVLARLSSARLVLAHSPRHGAPRWRRSRNLGRGAGSRRRRAQQLVSFRTASTKRATARGSRFASTETRCGATSRRLETRA